MKPRPLAARDPKQFPILYVDDEAANLRIFELTFRRDFTVLTAQSAEEGMQLLNENPVAVVLSDHKMPGMTGVEFLSRVRELDEHAIRILVTAYGDAETLGSAINDGRIYRYIAKPWNPDEMGETLRRAIERYTLDRERNTLIEELTFLNWLSRRLHRELDPERVVKLLIDAAHNELGFDAAAVLFFTPDRAALRWASIVPNDEVAEAVRGVEITRARAPQFVGDLEGGMTQAFSIDQVTDAEGPVRDWIRHVSAEELVVVPLAGQSGVIGALAIDNRCGGRRFGSDDRTLLDGLSTQAVIALDNARTVAALRSSRAHLQRADRLGLVGTLAMGVARELDEPLSAIEAFVRAAPERRRAGDVDFWTSDHAEVSGRLETVRSRVATLQQLAGGEEMSGAPATVDLGELASEVMSLLEREAKAARVSVVLDASLQTPKVVAHRGSLQQVLLTLVLRAIGSSPIEGRVVVRVQPDGDEPEELALLEVVDSGPGLEPEQLDRIFESLPDGEDASPALAFGLTIVHQIVREHRGTIRVRSAAGSGTTYSVQLPVDGPDAA